MPQLVPAEGGRCRDQGEAPSPDSAGEGWRLLLACCRRRWSRVGRWLLGQPRVRCGGCPGVELSFTQWRGEQQGRVPDRPYAGLVQDLEKRVNLVLGQSLRLVRGDDEPHRQL